MSALVEYKKGNDKLELPNGEIIVIREETPTMGMTDFTDSFGYGKARSIAALVGIGVIEKIEGNYSKEHHKPTVEYEEFFVNISKSSWKITMPKAIELQEKLRDTLREYVVKSESKPYYEKLLDEAIAKGILDPKGVARYIKHGGKDSE